MTLDNFTDLVIKLDKEDRISENLGKNIVEVYEKVVSLCIREKQVDLVMSVNGTLIDLSEKLSFVNKKKQFYFDIIEILFQVGLDAVENSMEDVIRNVSNHLGWIGKRSIDNKESEVLKAILNNAVKLINICNDFKVEEKTMIFIGTLFIILGGYSCSSKERLLFTNTILNNIRNINRKDILYKSKLIREYEGIYWNKYMDNNAKGNIEKFYKRVRGLN